MRTALIVYIDWLLTRSFAISVIQLPFLWQNYAFRVSPTSVFYVFSPCYFQYYMVVYRPKILNCLTSVDVSSNVTSFLADTCSFKSRIYEKFLSSPKDSWQSFPWIATKEKCYCEVFTEIIIIHFNFKVNWFI